MIDVASLVSQLMTVERQPLVALQNKESVIQSRLSAYGRVKSALSTLESAAEKLQQSSTFGAVKATVSGEGVVAASSGSGATGRYNIAISQLARAQSTASVAMDSTTTLGVGSLTITQGSTSATFNTGGTGEPTTLAGLRDAINANTTLGVRASLVTDGTQVRLVLTSEETGAANSFTVTANDALSGFGFTTQQAAQDASFSVNGLALTSASNTLDGVIEGVTMTLTKGPAAGSAPGTTVDAEVAVDEDGASIRESVEAFITAYNDLEKLIKELTAYDPTTKTAAILNGESSLRQIQNQVRSLVRGTMTAASSDYTRLSSIGIEFQTDGTLKLNTTKFDAAVAADPAKVSRLFSTTSTVEAEQGFAVRLETLINSIVDSDGSLDARQQGLQASIRRLDQQQEQMEARLDRIEARLIAQYSKLDALLATTQSQSTALANALAGLPSISSS
jgi:flagellar hook-associated protein 2